MSLTDAQLQQLIILEVGDEITSDFPTGVLAANIATIWERYADQSDTRLQQLYSKRACIDLVIGVVRGQVDFEIVNDHTRKQSQKIAALQRMRADCQAEISRITSAGVSFVPAVYGGEQSADEFARTVLQQEWWPWRDF